VTPEQPLRGNVILIVEDDVETLTALAQLIANGLGCRVLTALSGYEALDVIDSGVRVDLVFADVVMPEMDGMTLAFLIGRRLASLPVVLATGRSDVVDSVTERGGIALLKPYSLERLEAVFTDNWACSLLFSRAADKVDHRIDNGPQPPPRARRRLPTIVNGTDRS